MRMLLAAVTVLAVSTAQADTIYVDANCPGPGNGSEAEPYCSIQTAIDNAVDTDEVVVAPGTYFEIINYNGKAITVRSTDPLDPAVVAATVIDGAGFNDSVVKCISGEGSGTVLSGLTITGGTGDTTMYRGEFTVGGGMYNRESDATVTNCTFSGNSVTSVPGTAASGGGMYNEYSNPTVTNCTFSGNNANQFGGGIMNSAQGNAMFINCMFEGNTAGDGGGINIIFNATGTVINCILWNNGPNEIAGTPTALYNDVQGGYPGTGNIDADPLFVDPGNGDYRLQAGSPCIDAGDNTAVPEGITTDFDGNPRFLEIPETPDTGNGTLPIVDMGAYESLGEGCLAVTSQEIVCQVDGTTFTVNIGGLNACTGGTTQITFTASGGSVGEELCFTALVNDGGFCCTTEICVTIPDCTHPLLVFATEVSP